MMESERNKIRALYNFLAPFYDWEAAAFGIMAENSRWRKRTIDSLRLTGDSIVLDIA